MAFKFSLGGAKGSKSQFNSKVKEEEEAKAREEKSALDKVIAEFMEEHADEKSVLGESEQESLAEDVFVPTGSKRHFTGRQRNMKSGPGTLEPEPLENYSRPSATQGRLFTHTSSRIGGALSTGSASQDSSKQSNNVFSTLVAKASNLPPATEPRRIEKLFSTFPSLKVTRVEKIPPQGPALKGRPTATMRVIFDKDATARDLDDAMNKLNDKKYLGKGYYLHLDRYLGGRTVDSPQRIEPFGARWQAPEMPKGYAPPPDLGGGNRDRTREDSERLIITANQPPDIATLRLVHQTIESVILGGVEFEAALMNDPQVQEEERFAWLYDQKHPINRYYRWRMHQVVCDTANDEIFARYGAWVGPPDPLADEFVDQLGAFELDEDHSSDEDEDEQKPQHKLLPVGDNYPGRVDNGYGIMNPRSRTFFLWLLTSIPPGSIVADEIAAISNFAVQNASQGMDEIVCFLVSNVIAPFQLSESNLRHRDGELDAKDDIRRPDVRQVTLNALRIISDVLLVTAKESGVCYKYRLAIDKQMLDRNVFEYLERLPAQLQMGRMTERSYRDEVNEILKFWQEEHLFESSTLRSLDETFNSRERQKEEDDKSKRLLEKRKQKPVIARKDAMEMDTHSFENVEDAGNNDPEETVEEHNKDVNEQHDEISTEVATRPATSEPIFTQLDARQVSELEIPGESAAARARRLRPKAEDMFASDGE